MRRYFAFILLFSIVLGAAPPTAQAFEFNPNFIISDSEMVDSDSMDVGEIQLFLDTHGTLGRRTFRDIDEAIKPTAQIIAEAAQRNGISPRVILVMLQKEQSLIDDPTPSRNQLDWAMGYGICDGCTYYSASAQRFRGFAKQVNSATLQLREGYLLDLETRGRTAMGFGPGIAALIDDTRVIPANDATAALYTYTPHLHGNRNFSRLWQQWFTHDYPDGTLLQNTEDGGVWLIQYGLRRPITSRAALTTRFNVGAIVPVSPSALASYAVGKPISLPNYSLLRSPHGTVYLLVDDVVRGIASPEAFRAIGFNPDEIIDVTFDELAAFEEGEPITTETVYPQGALLQDPTTGGVFFAQNGTKSPIMSREILAARFPGGKIIPAQNGELALYPTVKPVLFPDGTLVGVSGRPDIFVISDGLRRPIIDEATFLTYGWEWTQIVFTDERSVLLHPLGESVKVERTNFQKN